MNDKQRTFIEARDEEICRVLQEYDNPLPHEAFLWCGTNGLDWDQNRIEGLTVALLEYGKPQALVEEIWKCWMDWNCPI